MHTVIVDISISADEFIKHYQFSGAVVSTHSRDGRSVRFPANILQRFITHTGVKGSFRIQFDHGGKFSGVERL
ncbi:DUF2835 domain-containing protein [Oceanicoccus sagamiensis]|uniref:Topoisomerase II n=1 Tax=Oceanicoccus sagamiensis TaxID=716816 RepID=A0A1X9NDP8_9GAMM|nr:DUF2835 domain-containing protein [Oceanicoccus sagamiensis]ARN76168.1 hypothetical protein BST96_19925 [Oceanicoccus sagamiensis]